VAHNSELLSSGTGFVVQRTIPSKAVFAYESMGSSSEDDDEGLVESAVNTEIRNLRVVDPHDICLKLFSKDFRRTGLTQRGLDPLALWCTCAASVPTLVSFILSHKKSYILYRHRHTR
jgi:hypothetical protein